MHIFHLKIRGKDNWGTIGSISRKSNRSRRARLDLTANQYPYTAMLHGWSTLFPVWARDGGPDKFADASDPAVRSGSRRTPSSITWSRARVVGGDRARAWHTDPENQKYVGHASRRHREGARRRRPGRHEPRVDGRRGRQHHRHVPHQSEDGRAGGHEAPWMAVASDGSAVDLDAARHSRTRAVTRPVAVLGHYVRDEKC